MNGRLLHIIFVLLATTVHGQDDVILSIEPRNAEVGEVLTITVKSKVHGDLEIDNLPSSFVQGYQVMNGMESEIDYETGELIRYYYFSQTGAIGTSGTYTIGPVYIKDGNTTYKSETVVVKIGDKTQTTSSSITAQQMQDPAFGVIQTNKREIYEGEPILVSAKVYSHFDPTHLDGYRSYTMKGAIDRHAIGNSTRINKVQERFKGVDLFAFEYDKNLIFPIGTGPFKINSFVMNLHQGYSGFMLTSSSAVVNIKPLPANPPNDFIGAVGTFAVNREIDETSIKQGDVFKMKVTVTGNGNLQNIVEPKPELPKGFVIYGDPVVEENFMYTSLGAEGEISYEYNIQVGKFGNIPLPPTTISYFDVNKEMYVTVSTGTDTFDIEKNNNFVVEEMITESENPEELSTLGSLRTSEIQTDRNALIGSPVFWIGVGTPLLSALLFLLFIKRRASSEEKIQLRQTIRKKDTELEVLLGETKVLAVADDQNQFYSKAEQTLKKAFEVALKMEDDRIINKQEILQYLTTQNDTSLADRVRSFIETCEQSRFGFAASDKPKQTLYSELTALVQEIRK